MFAEGDFVWVVSGASHIVREERIATKAVIMNVIPGDWYRVYMTWSDKTKIVDLPSNMLRKIKNPHTKDKK